MLLCFHCMNAYSLSTLLPGSTWLPTALPLWEVSWEHFCACLLALVCGPLPRRGIASAEDGHVSFASWWQTGLPSSQAGSHAQWGVRDLLHTLAFQTLSPISHTSELSGYCLQMSQNNQEKGAIKWFTIQNKSDWQKEGHPTRNHTLPEVSEARANPASRYQEGCPGEGGAPPSGKGFVALQGRWAKGRKSPSSLWHSLCCWCSECSFNGPDHIVGRHLRVPRGDGWPSSMVVQECGGQP